MTSRPVSGALLSIALLACGDAAPAPPKRATPDEATALRLLRDHIETDQAFADKLCGVAGAKLSNVEITLVRSPAGTAAGDVLADGSPPGPKRCEGSIVAAFDDEGVPESPRFVVKKLNVVDVRSLPPPK